MKTQIKFKVGRTEDLEYFLDIEEERVLKSEKLSDVVEKIASYLKKEYNIKENNFLKGFLGN